MTMIKQRDGVSRRRRGEVVRDANGKALPPEAYDIFYHGDHVGYTQRLEGGKFRAFPIDGSFPTEVYKNHTDAVDALVDGFIATGKAAVPAPAEAAPAPAKGKSTKAGKVTTTSHLAVVKPEPEKFVTPAWEGPDSPQGPVPVSSLPGQDVSIELTTPSVVVAAPAVEPCARCGSTEPHQHATPAPQPVAEPAWDAGYPEGPRAEQPPAPVADPFASMPPALGAVTDAEEPGWMAGPGFAPETPPFGQPATVGAPPFMQTGPDDPFEDVGFSDPFAEM